MFGLKEQGDLDNHKPAQIGWFCLSWTRWCQVKIKQMMQQAQIQRPLYGDTDSIFMPLKDWNKFIAINPNILLIHLGTPEELTGELEGQGKDELPFDGLIVTGIKTYCAYGDIQNKAGSRGYSKVNKLCKDQYLKLVADPNHKEIDKRLHFERSAKIGYDGRLYCYILSPESRIVTIRKNIPHVKQEDDQHFMINKFIICT